MRFRPATFIGFAFARYFFKFYENSDIRKLKVWPFQRREKFLYISYWASKMSSWIILNAKVTKVNIPLKSIDNIYYRTSGFWTYICMWLSTKFLKNSSSVTCMYKSAELYKFEHGNSELLESESWLNQFMHGGESTFPLFYSSATPCKPILNSVKSAWNLQNGIGKNFLRNEKRTKFLGKSISFDLNERYSL